MFVTRNETNSYLYKLQSGKLLIQVKKKQEKSTRWIGNWDPESFKNLKLQMDSTEDIELS